jgi:ankyrin repeat protein
MSMPERLHLPAARRRLRGLAAALAVVVFPLGSQLPPARAQSAADLKAFFEALEADDDVGIRRLLVRGLSSNLSDPVRGPAILIAAQAKAYRAVRALLESRLTELEVRNPAGETLLMYVALHGELDIARLLLRRGAQVNMSGWTPLHYAAVGGRTEMLALLLEHHAYVDAASANGTTPLMMAAREGQMAAVRFLVAQGADPSLRNEAGLGAPEYLARRGDMAEARWLADRASEFLKRYGTRESPVSAESVEAPQTLQTPQTSAPSPAPSPARAPMPGR